MKNILLTSLFIISFSLTSHAQLFESLEVQKFYFPGLSDSNVRTTGIASQNDLSSHYIWARIFFTSYDQSNYKNYKDFKIYFNNELLTHYKNGSFQFGGAIKKLDGFGELKLVDPKNNKTYYTIKANFKNGKINGFGEIDISNEYSQFLFTHYYRSSNKIVGETKITFDTEKEYLSIKFKNSGNEYIVNNKPNFKLLFNGNKFTGILEIGYSDDEKFLPNFGNDCVHLKIHKIEFANGDVYTDGKIFKANSEIWGGDFEFNNDGTMLVINSNKTACEKLFPNGKHIRIEYGAVKNNGSRDSTITIEKGGDEFISTQNGCKYFCKQCSAAKIIWSGKCSNGLLNGQGTLELFGYDSKNLSTYNGLFVNGKENGIGTVTYNDGNKYTGNWINGIKQGSGTWFWSDNSKYVGAFKNDNFNGTGTTFWPNGKTRSKGTFKDDNLFTGTRYYEDGTIEYTILNGVKKLSSAAERIAKLESQIENNRTESNNSRVQNERNQEAQSKAYQLENWKNSPCLITNIEEKEWEKILGNNEQLLHYVTFLIPKSVLNEYDEKTATLYHFHQTKGVFDDEKYYWKVNKPTGVYDKFNSQNDALKGIANAYGCKSWSFK